MNIYEKQIKMDIIEGYLCVLLQKKIADTVSFH